MEGVMVEKEKIPEWAIEVLLEEVRVINQFMKILDKDNKN